MQEIVAAWNATVDRKLGLFSPDPIQFDPLAPEENISFKPSPPYLGAHSHWVKVRTLDILSKISQSSELSVFSLKFLIERIEIVKYSSLDQVELFANMLHRSLTIFVGKAHGNSRHIATVGTRFRLLNSGLSLVQGEALPSSLSKSVLRERIYSAAIDYFW